MKAKARQVIGAALSERPVVASETEEALYTEEEQFQRETRASKRKRVAAEKDSSVQRSAGKKQRHSWV